MTEGGWPRLSPEGDDQDIPVGGASGIQRLDRRDAVVHARVIDKGCVERLRQREIADIPFGAIVNRRHSAGDILPRDQEDEHPVDAVLVKPFGRRKPLHAGVSFDAELVDLDMPDGGLAPSGVRLPKRSTHVRRIACMAGCAPMESATGANQRSMPPFSGL